MNRSRGNRYARSRSRLRKESRTIPIPGNTERGDGEDDGKYYRCWHCGFICDVERDELGDAESTHGVSYRIYDQQYSSDGNVIKRKGSIDGTLDDGTALIDMTALGKGLIVLKNGLDGTPQGIRENWEPNVTSGCPLCGCRNWRGDY